MELVSIVIPVFNGEKYINDCVTYIKNQIYQNWEAIFVNDGSSDQTSVVCSQCIQDDSRFRLYNKANGGTSSTRNVGIEYAAGKYITFWDVDDEYDPNFLSEMVKILEMHNADMAICGYFFKVEIEKRGLKTIFLEKKNYKNAFYRNFDELKEDYVELWASDMMYNIWNKIYRMDVIKSENIRYREGHVYTEDRVFNRQFIEVTQSVAVTEQCLYYYVRERIGSTSEKYREDYFEIRKKEYAELKEHFKKIKLWNEQSREYVSREFVERIAGTIENIFHAKKQLSAFQKYKKINQIVGHTDVVEATKYARCRSRKMRFFVSAIQRKNVLMVYMLGAIIFNIRNSNPILFHKIKSRR